MQGAEDNVRIGQTTCDKVEARQIGGDDWYCRPGGVAHRAVPIIGKEKLHAIAQVVVKRDLGDRDVDGDLQFGSVELGQRARNNPVVFLAGVNKNRIVGDV